MIQNKLKSFQDRIAGYTRAFLQKINLDNRIIIVLVMLLIFGGISIYMTVSSIRNMGRKENRHLKIEHIKSLGIHQEADSIINNNNDHE